MRIMEIVVAFARLWGEMEVMVPDLGSSDKNIRYLQDMPSGDCYDYLYKWANEYLSSANNIIDQRKFFSQKISEVLPVF